MRRVIINGAICCALLLAGARAVVAQQTSPFQVLKSKLSEVEFYTTNYGVFGLDIGGLRSGFIAPRGSGLGYMFGAGLWFGARKKVNGDTNDLIFLTYDPNVGTGWATPDGGTVLEAAERLYHSVNYDHETGRPTTAAAGDAAWPLWLVGSEPPRPGDPGLYVTRWSDRAPGPFYPHPAFMPGVAEQFVASFNDAKLAYYRGITADSARSIGYPLGLSIQQNVYAWSEGAFKDMVMVQYNIRNTSTDTLFNCVASQLTDPDVGNAMNDHASFFTRRPDLRASYIWTEPESGKSFKVLMAAIVEGPVTNEDGYIELFPITRKRYRMEGRAGSFQAWQIEEDPRSIQERYLFMNDRTQFDIDNGPGDKRTLLGTTRFNLRPGETAHFTVVYGLVDARPSETEGGSEMERLLEGVNEAYYARESFVAGVPGEEPASTGGITALPNPARDRSTLRFTTSASADVSLRLVNDLGEMVREERLGRLERGGHEATIDLAGLPAGIYLASVTAGAEHFTAKLTVMR